MGEGGCCITRYSNGSVYYMSQVDKIMLRFRPIAPKPDARERDSLSGGSPPTSTDQGSSKTARGKRKYNKKSNKKNNNYNKKRKPRSEESKSNHKTSSDDSVVTLSLLPETPGRKESPAKEKSESPIVISFGSKDKSEPLDSRHESLVMVESVTDTWQDVNVLGLNNREKMVNLGRDTCPGFISDGLDRVLWTNNAYDEMVGREGEEVIVRLVMKERVPIMCDAFSCMVRLKSKGAVLVPCDVWRMEGGGFAWRLDVDMALSLGCYNV